MPLASKPVIPHSGGTKKAERTRSIIQEKRLAKDLKAKRQPNSGATPYATKKGDLVMGDYLIEAKRTDASQITITTAVISKICGEAGVVGKIPVLEIEIDGMPIGIPKQWVLISYDLFKEFTNA